MSRYKLDYKIIVQNVKALRTAKDLTQEQLGELSGLSHNTISKFETNRKNINLDTFIKIANALDVDIYFLLGHSPDNTQKPTDLLISSLLEDFTEQDKDLLVSVITAIRLYKKNSL